MKAVVFHEHGGIDKLSYEDVPEPAINETEVLVRVKACALNHLDIWVRKDPRGAKIPFPHILGSDIAGIVEKVGQSVSDVRPGDEVIIAPGLSCNRCVQCLSGNDSLCDQFKIMGFQVNGGYAEFAKAPRANIMPIRGGLSFEEAASVPLVFLTAWHMLVTRARISALDKVLIVAASSGVGSAAVQIAKLWGAYVIASAGSEDKLRKSRELGADETINHTTQDLREEVRRLTGGRGVDLVFEHVGSAVWDKALGALTRGGRLVTCGATTGNIVQLDLRYLYSHQLSVMGSFMGSKSDLLQVLKQFQLKKFKAVVDRVFPLAEAAKAQQTMEERKHFGKLVLKP